MHSPVSNPVHSEHKESKQMLQLFERLHPLVQELHEAAPESSYCEKVTDQRQVVTNDAEQGVSLVEKSDIAVFHRVK